jgi:O-antigen/teichoic acid export membrane protein
MTIGISKIVAREHRTRPAQRLEGVSEGRLPSLRRNFSWALFGNLVYSACNWAMILVIAKLGKPEMVGQYAIGQAVTSPIILLARLQLRYLQVTDTSRDYQFLDYLGLRLITLVLAMLAITGITWWGYQGATVAVILAVGLLGSVESISDIFYGLMQKNEKMDIIALSMASRGILWLVAMAVTIHFTRNVIWGLVGASLVSLAVLVMFDVPNAVGVLRMGATIGKHDSIPISLVLKKQARLALLSAPIGITVMLNSYTSAVPRYFLMEHIGEYGLGIFAAVASLLGIGERVTGSLGQSACPRLARLYASASRKGFTSLLWKVVGISVLVGALPLAAAIVAGEGILTVLFKPEYAREDEVLIWLLASGVLHCVTSGLGVGLTAARRFKLQVPMSAIGLGTAALTNWLLIPGEGLRGAAISAFITSTCLLFCYTTAVFYLVSRSPWPKTI